MTGTQLRGIAEQVGRIDDILSSEDQSLCDQAAQQLGTILTHAVFLTADGTPAVAPPHDGRALRDWWARGGARWIEYQTFGMRGEILSFPPTMRHSLSSGKVPDAIVCEQPNCDPETNGFMRTSVVWGLRLEAFERGRLFPYQWNRVDAKGGRPNPMQRSCEEEDLTEWTACVTQNRSVQIGFPLAEYRRPRSGWIFVERASEARSDHMNVIAVDLESGDTVWKQGGNLRTGRGNVRHFGEFALVTMLAKHAAEFSDGQILAIPNHLQPGPACSMSADPPDDPTRVSTHSTLTFWWWHNDNVISKVQLTTYGYNQPAGDLARKLLDIAQSEIISESREITKPDPTPSTDARLMQIVDELWESSARQQGGGPRKGQLDRAASDDRESDRK